MPSTDNKRFSKNKVIALIETHIKGLQAVYDFNPNDGWMQVKGTSEAKNRAFGEYDRLRLLLNDIHNL